ncbi:TPA: enterochelin ABC transporter substrate-binding protein, partial [Mannheimia haemolytica]|nr:enterochelin ABC transporter substrate-binding protein [Mannheimia haemolytica]
MFDTGSLDTLQALGVKIDGMPEFKVLSYLKPSADKAVNVGTVFEPDLEALNSLNPDLIIVGTC